MPKNKIETLRAICFTKEDIKTITNLGDSFTDKEIEFMVEFKKIYELGVNQLKKFIDKLDEEGKDLDEYSIQYYIEVLRKGPLANYMPNLTIDKKYFPNTPDSMGTLGNKTKSPPNVTLYENVGYSLGGGVDTFNKLPAFIQTTLTDAIKITENVFRNGLTSTTVSDNTLPVMDKKPKDRYKEEDEGKWVLKSNGSYLVKDKYHYLAIVDKSEDIFAKVKKYLGEETFRLWADKKLYKPFDSETNNSTSSNSRIEKEFKNGDKKEIIILDLMGDVFDSEEKRATVLKVSSDAKGKEYLLNTNVGQLGN